MKKSIRISFSQSWIFEHRSDDVLPVDRAVDVLKNEFSDSTVESSGFTDINMVIEADDSDSRVSADFVKDLLMRSLTVSDSGIINVSIVDVAPEKKDEQPVASEPEQATDKPADESTDLFAGLLGGAGTSQKKSEKAGNSDGEKVVDIDSATNRINGLVGCDEFKKIIDELILVAPGIKSSKTFSSFLFQNYLFAINDGYGLSTYLECFADVIGALGLFTFNTSEKIMEIKISVDEKRTTLKEVLAQAIRKIGGGFSSGGKIVCIDLSEQMSNVNSADFKEFFKSLEDLQDQNIIVFRIPFVEKDTLNDISGSIADVLYVRNVSFVPFSIEELHICATNELNKFGFSMDDTAWQVFDSKISEEKSDGRFYGINTVNKIVREMIYKKHIVNAEKNENTTVICSDDIINMSKTYDANFKTAQDMLDSLYGMDSVKEQIYEIVAQISHAAKNKDVAAPCMHMRFVGNPGTGKTTVARIIGKMLSEKGILRNGHFFEYSGRDLCGRYVGETAPKTAAICRDAYGSVLFIDEAYSLYVSESDIDYGKEALTTLIAEMENHRAELVVIMAGYKDEMNTLMKGNAGLASRLPFTIDFPNFSREELYNIFVNMVKSEFEYDDSLLEAAKEYFDSLEDGFISSKEFSNARFVRNIYERTWGKAAVRGQMDKSDNIVLTAEDFRSAVNNCGSTVLNTKKKNRIGF